MNRINFLPPWVETNLQPAFYDAESGTVLQQTARMYAKVNQLIRNVNDQNETIELYIAKFIELRDYVHDYFDNLDVQEEINNKLDDMVEQGTLQEIITDYIQANVAWAFDTVADMKSSTNLIAGSYAQTLGFHSLNDGGGAIYKITDTGTANEMDVIAVGDLYANLILPTELRPEMLGAYGDDLQDDTDALKRCIELKHKIVGAPEKIYKITYIHTDVDYIYLNGLNIHPNSVSPTSPEISINTYKRALQFESNGNFTFINCNFTTEADQENTTTWLSEYTTTPCSNIAFLQFNHHVKNLNIEKCTFENAIFDIWVDGGSDTVEGNANVEDCTSKNTCIFFDSRYLLNTYINNCKAKQADTATSYSHLVYCTFGEGMNITIDNTELVNGVNGGAVIDCYHGSNYNLVVNNTNMNVIKSAQYALLCCDGGKAVITNCNIKSDYLIYQSTLTANSNARFVNCNIDVNSFNANISSSDIACEFIGCDIKTSGCYRNNSMTDSTKTKLVFKSSKINLIDGNIRYYNIKAIDSEFYIKDSASAFILTFQNAGLVKNCYFENLPDSVSLSNNFWDVTANATTFVNNITKNLDANKFYNGTEINTTVIA